MGGRAGGRGGDRKKGELFLPVSPALNRNYINEDRGRGSVGRASGFNSEDPGFDPLTGQGGGQFFCLSESTLV